MARGAAEVVGAGHVNHHLRADGRREPDDDAQENERSTDQRALGLVACAKFS
jgi:hypothetical protein